MILKKSVRSARNPLRSGGASGAESADRGQPSFVAASGGSGRLAGLRGAALVGILLVAGCVAISGVLRRWAVPPPPTPTPTVSPRPVPVASARTVVPTTTPSGLPVAGMDAPFFLCPTVTALAFSPDSQQLAAVTHAGGIRIVPLAKPAAARTLPTAPALAVAWISPDWIASCALNVCYVVGLRQPTPRMVALIKKNAPFIPNTLQVLHSTPACRFPSVLPDPAFADIGLACVDREANVRLFTADAATTGTLVLKPPPGEAASAIARSGQVALRRRDGSISIRSIISTTSFAFSASPIECTGVPGLPQRIVRFGTDLYLQGADPLDIWSGPIGRPPVPLLPPPDWNGEHAFRATSTDPVQLHSFLLVPSPAQRWLVVASRSALLLVDTRRPTSLTRLPFRPTEVVGVAFSPDEHHLAVATHSGEVHLRTLPRR